MKAVRFYRPLSDIVRATGNLMSELPHAAVVTAWSLLGSPRYGEEAVYFRNICCVGSTCLASGTVTVLDCSHHVPADSK